MLGNQEKMGILEDSRFALTSRGLCTIQATVELMSVVHIYLSNYF